MTDNNETRARLLALAATAARYCALAEQTEQPEREEWLAGMALALPRMYAEVQALPADEVIPADETGFLAEYVDEDMYETVRTRTAALLGEDDVYLETFEEDMKYSDTPVAATVSEGIADIYQAVYNFIGVVKDSEGLLLPDAFIELKEGFESHWSQTLCNTLRAVNALLRR